MSIVHVRWRWPFLLSGAVLVVLTSSPALAQPSPGTPEARAEVERGKKALERKQASEAIAAFRHAVELDPRFLDAHQQFVFAARWRSGEKPDVATPNLRQLYAQWIAQAPGNAVLQFMAAQLEEDLDKIDAYYQRAVALDPKFAHAWFRLAMDADHRGDRKSRNEYGRRAAEADPDDPQYLFYYASMVWESDPARWTKLALQVVERFPNTERAPQALYWLGYRAPTDAQKIAHFERLKRDYPPEKSRWSLNGAMELCRLYAASQPERALALAREMVARFSVEGKVADPTLAHMGRTVWTERVNIEETVQRARAAMASGKADEALALLDGLKLPVGDEPTATRVNLLKAEAEAASAEPSRAYERLATLVAVEPREPYVGALSRIAAGQKRGEADVKADLRQRREKLAKPAPDFTLASYLDDAAVTLSALRGKVVLLDFWYPG